MNDLSVIIVGAYTVTLVFGGAITVSAYRAFVRTGTGRLRSLALGFGLATAGTLISLAVYQLALFPLLGAVAIQSIAVAGGFVVIAHSLQSNRSSTDRSAHVLD